MRQLISLRFVAALAALAGLALFVNTVVASDDDRLEAVVEPEIEARRIDLIEPVFSSERSDDFEIGADGITVGYLDVILTGPRVMRIAPGTPGEITCRRLAAVNGCTILADLLGDAVVWFAILPQAERATVELPPVIDLQDGYAIFENGWQIPYAEVIERDCGNVDIPTFSEFLRNYSNDSVSIVDIELQQVVRVRCSPEVVTSTSVPDTAPPVSTLDVAPDAPPAAPLPSAPPVTTP